MYTESSSLKSIRQKAKERKQDFNPGDQIENLSKGILLQYIRNFHSPLHSRHILQIQIHRKR